MNEDLGFCARARINIQLLDRQTQIGQTSAKKVVNISTPPLHQDRLKSF